MLSIIFFVEKKEGIELIGYAGGFEVPQRLFCFINVDFGKREREGGGGRMEESLANWVWFGLNVVLVWLELERDGFGKKKEINV